jgi:glucose-1-phosphate adenylyltransferase
MLEEHVASGAGITVGCVPVPIEISGSFGVLGLGPDLSVRSFIEKPAPATLEATASSMVHASMGIYVFDTDHLL